jgi:hypothetical protein
MIKSTTALSLNHKTPGIVNSWVDHWGFGPFDTSYVSASGLGVGA